MAAKHCPHCGATQAWVMWKRCACGYDFGPPVNDRGHSPKAAAPWLPENLTQRMLFSFLFLTIGAAVGVWRHEFAGIPFICWMAATWFVPRPRPVEEMRGRDLVIIGLLVVAVFLACRYLDQPFKAWKDWEESANPTLVRLPYAALWLLASMFLRREWVAVFQMKAGQIDSQPATSATAAPSSQ